MFSVLATTSMPTIDSTTQRGYGGLDVGRQSAAGDVADARADDLDRRHQRQREHDGPQHREAELRAGLRVGGDAARIVVGRAGDQAGSELPQASHAARREPDARFTDSAGQASALSRWRPDGDASLARRRKAPKVLTQSDRSATGAPPVGVRLSAKIAPPRGRRHGTRPRGETPHGAAAAHRRTDPHVDAASRRTQWWLAQRLPRRHAAADAPLRRSPASCSAACWRPPRCTSARRPASASASG